VATSFNMKWIISAEQEKNLLFKILLQNRLKSQLCLVFPLINARNSWTPQWRNT